ncbi:MAG: matrixin family metalloprotease [Patescibacteria group bacterium]|nr:matrixin family metalloprotease [Patescibacteria group bacterium]
MRKFFGTILPLLLAVACVFAFWHAEVHTPCASPLTYRIGAFDTRFGVSEADFLSAAKEAATVWNTAAGKTVLSYDQNGSVPLNLIYDSRQATTQKNETLQSSIENGKQVADSVKQRYSALTTRFDTDRTSYEAQLNAYNKNLDAYNQEVEYWNQQGGAPKSEFEKLNNEKITLDRERTALETQRANLNAEADDINSLIDQYNLVVDHVNATVGEVNQTAGREFEEGEYVSDASGRRINIYEFEDHARLVRVLAHEMGHALGLSHNANPQSIMYYLNQSTNLVPSAEDIASLEAICEAK